MDERDDRAIPVPRVERDNVLVFPMPRVERNGVLVSVNGDPTLWLASPVMTRPQDWAPAARALLWPQLVQAERRA